MSPLPHFNNNNAIYAFEPVHSNLYDANLYDSNANTQIPAENIVSVSFIIFKNSELVTLKVYNSSEQPLTFDVFKEIKFLSVVLNSKKGIVQTSFYELTFNKIEVTYTYDKIDIDCWTIEYEIKSKNQSNSDIGSFVRDAKLNSII